MAAEERHDRLQPGQDDRQSGPVDHQPPAGNQGAGGGSFLTAQVNQDDVSRSADVTFVSLTPLTDDWQAALRDVRAVIADAMQRPPTQEEIDREVAELDVAFQVPVEQRRILPGSQLADDLVMALDIRETVASPEAVLDIFRRSRPLFHPAGGA
ncbi:hypothetical protein ACFSTD_06550 [Novosphingobium colocasiae]